MKVDAVWKDVAHQYLKLCEEQKKARHDIDIERAAHELSVFLIGEEWATGKRLLQVSPFRTIPLTPEHILTEDGPVKEGEPLTWMAPERFIREAFENYNIAPSSIMDRIRERLDHIARAGCKY